MHYKKKVSEETQIHSIFQYVRTSSSTCVFDRLSVVIQIEFRYLSN